MEKICNFIQCFQIWINRITTPFTNVHIDAFSICLCRNSYPHRKSFPQCESALFCTKHSECRFMRKGTTIIRTSKTLSPIHIQEYTRPHTGWYGDGCYHFAYEPTATTEVPLALVAGFLFEKVFHIIVVNNLLLEDVCTGFR